MNVNFKKAIVSSIVVFAGIGLIGCSNSGNVETLEYTDTNVVNDSDNNDNSNVVNDSDNNDNSNDDTDINERDELKESALRFLNYTVQPSTMTIDFVVSGSEDEAQANSGVKVISKEEAVQRLEENLYLSNYVSYDQLTIDEQLELFNEILGVKSLVSLLSIDYDYFINADGFTINDDRATINGDFILVTLPEIGTESLGSELSLDLVKTENGWKVDGQSAYNAIKQ